MWAQLFAGGFTFVERAGKNIDIHGVLKATGKMMYRNGLVRCWPQTAINRDAKPLVLRLVEVMAGRKRLPH